LEFDGDVEITSAFECGSGENFILQGPDHFSVELETDPIPITEAVPVGNVCVQVTNYGQTPRQVKLDIIVHPILREMNWSHGVKGDYFIKRAGAWSLMPVEKKMCGENIYRLFIDVGPGEQVVVSNEMPYAYSKLLRDLDQLAATHSGKVLRRSYGKSVQGRDLEVLTFGERPGAPRLALVCTPQPNEPATWLIMGVADFLAGSDPMADELLARFVVDLMPMTVPDGVVAGWRKVNAQGVQPLFEYEKAACGESDVPEAALEWEWLAQHPPAAFAEMHYVSKRCADKPSQPYLIDRALYSSDARREQARRLERAIAALEPGGAFRNIEAGDKVWRTMISYQLVKCLDSLAFMYQIIGLGIPAAQARAVEVLRTMAHVLA
jgi:hypothetical protein